MAKKGAVVKAATEHETDDSAKKLSYRLRALAIFDRLKRKTIFRLVVLWLCAYLVLLSLVFTTVLSNFSYIEIFPKELIFPMALKACTALLIALSIFWLPQLRTYFARLASAITLALLLVGYDSGLQAAAGLIQALIPGLTDSDPLYLTSAVYLLILYVLAIFAGKAADAVIAKQRFLKPRDLQYGMLVLVGYLFLVPVFSLADILPSMIRETNARAPEFIKGGDKPAASKPDVYYIVLDRYGSSELLREQFSFDNSRFVDYLRANDFYVNESAYANYPYTAMSVSSTMIADYTYRQTAPFRENPVQTRTLFHNLVQQSPVVKAFKREGYKYFTVNSRYGLSYKAPLADQEFVHQYSLSVLGVNKRLRGIEAIEFMKSPYYRFAQIPAKAWPLKLTEIDPVTEVRQQLGSLDELAAQEPGGRLIFAHVLIPHDPYLFNADSSLAANPNPDSVGMPVKRKYTNQVQFINTQMRELIDTIQERSGGKAVILLNSDEGPYPQMLNDTFDEPQTKTASNVEGAFINEDMRRWPDDWLRMKFGILQAVHIPEANGEDLSQLSSINAFRIVLNRYLGYDLPYLPQCHFGLTRGAANSYRYADITDRFNEAPDPECQKLQSS